MSRDSMPTLADPVFRSNMPLFDGTVASSGLSKPLVMSGFLGKQTLQYNGAYFTYEPRVKDREGFSPPWTHSKTSPLDDRSPVSHLSGMVQNHIAYRKDSISAEGGHHTPVKRGFTVYTKSPELNSRTAASPVAIRKPKPGGENPPSPSQSSVYLAIPKPVYGLSPCCNELGCVLGHQYSMEHISPRIPNAVYEHEWMQTNGHYLEKLPVQRKEALLRQKDLQFECGAEQLKRVAVEAYSPSRVRTLPSVMEPSYSSYPCTPPRALFGSLREPSSQPLQTFPAGYPSLYAPRPTYEHMTSDVYQECSPMSKYGQLAQHPGFYYSQTNGEVENRTQRKESGTKQGEDGPLLHKHSLSSPREHYVVPQPHHAEIPLSCTEMLPNRSFIQGYDYPCYTVPRFHLAASQIGAPLKRPNSISAFHPSRINAPSSSQDTDHPMGKKKPNTAIRMDQLHSSSSFIRVNKSSPARHLSPAAVSPSSIQMGRFFQPFTSLHIDPSVHPRPAVNMERIRDHCPAEAQVKEPKSHPISPAPCHSSDRTHTAVPNSFRKIIYSPAVTTGSKHNGPVSDAGTGNYKKCLKRSVSHSSHPLRIKDEDVYEVECTDNKRQKVETEKAEASNKTDSPPMPVIDNVFSLAPYQLHLQQSGVLFSGRQRQKTTQTSEKHNDKLKANAKENRLDQIDQESVLRLQSKSSSETSADESSVDAKKIKAEKVDLPDVNDSTESQNSHNKVAMKKEPEETQSPVSVPVELKDKCDSNELENQSLFASENNPSDELKPAESTLQTDPIHEEETLKKQEVTMQPKASASPPPGKVSFKSIPPHCLKLSTYNIIIPDAKHCKIALPAKQNPRPPPMTVLTAKLKPHTPVRKHFLELHQSLCSLISESVSSSSEQDLKSWLSQLEISEPSSQSGKLQKVPCLLGAKAREAWINQEIKAALREVLKRLREYTAQKHCPFPHVMRTGAVFLPMLVVKELLFPTVHGSFVDKVLQEHKVELRPTTLSEEKILIQLHKRACTSKLRRLMSLKHLPDIYTELVNLLYYTCVCKHLGLNMDSYYKEQEGGHEVSNSGTPAPCDTPASPASPSESHRQGCVKEEEASMSPRACTTKGRVKSGARQTFLDKSSSDEEGAGDAEQAVVEGDLESFLSKTRGAHLAEDREPDPVAAEQDAAAATKSTSDEDSWTCPLTLEELSPSHSDAESESSSSLLPGNPPSGRPVQSKNCSGMILKLRKMLNAGLKRKRACYEAVSQSETQAEPSSSQTGAGQGEGSDGNHNRMPKALRRWKGKGSFCHPGRPHGSPSKTKQRSLLKIKYCPYLSACHSAEHRRRWVLRSAVQTAQRAMRLYYPDLVGKRIRHLYEEDDKSEVWYRGEVLRVHEAHSNPMKTIFEVRYDSEPEWRYYLELLIDYKKGWLKIED